jgi:hypothetical protein
MPLNPQNLSNGQEQFESYPHPFRRGKMLCQFDYRDQDGELFSCVAPDLGRAMGKRDEWLERKARIADAIAHNVAVV